MFVNVNIRPNISVNINVNVWSNLNVWTNVNVNEATYVTSKQNKDEVEEALKFLRPTKTKSKKPLNFLDGRSLRLTKKGKQRHLYSTLFPVVRSILRFNLKALVMLSQYFSNSFRVPSGSASFVLKAPGKNWNPNPDITASYPSSSYTVVSFLYRSLSLSLNTRCQCNNVRCCKVNHCIIWSKYILNHKTP